MRKRLRESKFWGFRWVKEPSPGLRRQARFLGRNGETVAIYLPRAPAPGGHSRTDDFLATNLPRRFPLPWPRRRLRRNRNNSERPIRPCSARSASFRNSSLTVEATTTWLLNHLSRVRTLTLVRRFAISRRSTCGSEKIFHVLDDAIR